MFNATALLQQWNSANCEHKEITKFFDNANTKLFIEALIKEEKLNTQNSAYLKSRGKNGGTWMHPILFIKFAMWLNPRFEVQVIKFVYDQMLKYRNDAGDAYRELGSAVQKIVDHSWMPIAMKNIAKALNFIVFGNHGREMRNKQGDEVKMRELFELERQIALLVNDGFLKNYNALIEYLRRKWKDKYLPLRTAPMMMFSSALTHLFGGSAGREGAAVQIGAAVSYWAGQKLHIKHTARIFLVAGMAAGFSGLFGTPVAAVLYAVEVLLAGTLDYRALLPACTASFSAVAVSRALGLPSSDYALSFQPELSLALVCKLAALGLVFGLTGGLFAFCLRKGREWGEKAFKNPYVRAAVLGVCLTVLLFLARGRYSGLGSNLIELSMTGGRVYPYDWVLKLFFTVLTLSAGLKGGEVTPLFSIGASLGAVLAGVVGLPVPVTAAVGYVCVFGGATNTFFAPLFVGAELFGYELLPFFFVACVVARLFNFGQSIYPLQRKFRFKKSV